MFRSFSDRSFLQGSFPSIEFTYALDKLLIWIIYLVPCARHAWMLGVAPFAGMWYLACCGPYIFQMLDLDSSREDYYEYAWWLGVLGDIYLVTSALGLLLGGILMIPCFMVAVLLVIVSSPVIEILRILRLGNFSRFADVLIFAYVLVEAITGKNDLWVIALALLLKQSFMLQTLFGGLKLLVIYGRVAHSSLGPLDGKFGVRLHENCVYQDNTTPFDTLREPPVWVKLAQYVPVEIEECSVIELLKTWLYNYGYLKVTTLDDWVIKNVVPMT